MKKQCVTHHYGCYCRENKMEKLEKENKILREALEEIKKIASTKEGKDLWYWHRAKGALERK